MHRIQQKLETELNDICTQTSVIQAQINELKESLEKLTKSETIIRHNIVAGYTAQTIELARKQNPEKYKYNPNAVKLANDLSGITIVWWLGINQEYDYVTITWEELEND